MAVHTHTHAHDHAPELGQIGLEAFGVPVAISAPPEVLPRVESVLPHGWRRREPTDEDHRFILRPLTRSSYRIEDKAGTVSGSSDLQVVLEVLDARLRGCIARNAPAHIFVHAGVVGYDGRAIVIPGVSFSGKTTLVAELVRAGATYYSDEYAVLDANGLVHPYPKPLSIRVEGRSQTDRGIDTFGGVAGNSPLPIGLITVAPFSPGAVWQPRRLSEGEAVLTMMANAIPAQERPDQALPTIKGAVSGAIALEGERGEAAEIVSELLATVAAQPRSAHA
jgi:hypothetical protein